jgi:N-acetylglucosamine-6-phosphate deacetylase
MRVDTPLTNSSRDDANPLIGLRAVNGRILVGDEIRADVCLDFADGRIADISDRRTARVETIDLEGGWLLPGFIDIQVNGGGGVLFNDSTDVEGIATIAAAHAKFGTTAFLPTLISDHAERIAVALDAVDSAIAAGVPGVAGIHLEGPFLAADRKGIHDDRHFRQLDAAMIALLTRPRRGVVVVTIAPELAKPEEIRALVAAGVRVSAGHTEADETEARAAFEAGVSGVTHLFNAMRPMLHRAPGLVGAALDDPRPWCGLIADAAHVSPTVLRVAIKAGGPDRMMLVTDAMPSVGAAQKAFVLQGKPISVVDGICSYADGTLAGSDLDMARAFSNAVNLLKLHPATASAMASANPASFLGLSDERGRIAPGLRADLVWLGPDFAPRATWIGGVRAA